MNETHVKIIEAWEQRAKAQNLVHNEDMKEPDVEYDESNEDSVWDWECFEKDQRDNMYIDRQLEFFLGAHTALTEAGLPGFNEMFLLILVAGRKASDFKPKVQA